MACFATLIFPANPLFFPDPATDPRAERPLFLLRGKKEGAAVSRTDFLAGRLAAMNLLGYGNGTYRN